MKRSSQNALLVAGILLFFGGGSKLALGQWHAAIWILLGLGVGGVVFAVVNDWSWFKSLMAMRTTKHGLNMGALILIAVVGLVVVNFLSVRYEKRWDMTSEGLNSLSEQSTKIVEAIKEPIEVVLLTNREQGVEGDVRAQVQELVRMYRDRTKLIEFKSYSARQEPGIAKKFEFPNIPYGLYIAQGERRIKVDAPTEEALTKALLKLTRDKKKVVYFTIGHGEKDLESRQPDGMASPEPGYPTFKEDLSDLYEIKTLSLAQTPEVPADAAIVAVVGPKQEFADVELGALKNFARRGGSFLIAIDPGERHNLQLFTKTLGIEFQNNYLLEPSPMAGRFDIRVLGTRLSAESPITRGFPAGSFAIFLIASELKKATSADPSLVFEELVSTDNRTLATDSIGEGARPSAPQSRLVAAAARGRLALAADKAAEKASKAEKANEKDGKSALVENPPETKEYSAVVIGDSDVLTNLLYPKNQNRDLMMNAVASLAKDDDMISIRPKSPKATNLQVTPIRANLVFLGLLIPLPLLLLGSGGVMWWRRRTA